MQALKLPGANDSIWADYGQSDETGSVQEHRENQPLVQQETRSRLSACNKTTVIKVTVFVANSSVFALTTYFGIKTILDSGNVGTLSFCALFNGSTFSVNGHYVFSPTYRREINRFLSNWSYEMYLTASQIYLNLASSYKYSVPFIWFLGVLLMKDVLTLGSKRQIDLPPYVPAPNEEELFRTIGFTTRNRSCGFKLMLTAQAASAVGLSVFNFICRDNYQNWGSFGKIGMYQDMIALFSGSVIGEILARVGDDWKEVKETERISASEEDAPPSRTLKALRVAKTLMELFPPLIVGTLLAIPAPANSVQDYAIKISIGAVFGSSMLLARREFENPRSYRHAVKPAEEIIDERTSACKRKVCFAVRKYLPSIGFLGALTAFMIYAATQDPPQAIYAIIVLLVTTFTSFIATDALSMTYKPQVKHRFRNELSFRLMYSSIALAIFFQYLTTKLNIGDESLNQDDTSLYVLALITWAFWGLNVGSNRALHIQRENPYSLDITPPIAMQELFKTFSSTLIRSFLNLRPPR